MKRLISLVILVAIVATSAYAATRRTKVVRTSSTIVKAGELSSTFGVPNNATSLAFYAEGTITTGVDSGLICYFRGTQHGRTIKFFTPLDSVAATMGAGVDTTDGTRFSIYYPLDPVMLCDTLTAYVKLLDNADADSAETVKTWFQWYIP